MLERTLYNAPGFDFKCSNKASDFEIKMLRRVRFRMKVFSTCQILKNNFIKKSRFGPFIREKDKICIYRTYSKSMIFK